LAGTVLGACSAAPVPPDRYWRLEVAVQPATAPINSVIGVDPVRGGGVYSERALLYLHGGAVEQRRYDFWTQSPDLLIEDALLRHLRAAFGADHVVTAGARSRADITVRTRIARLEQLTDAGARMALVLEFVIADGTGRTLA